MLSARERNADMDKDIRCRRDFLPFLKNLSLEFLQY